MEEWRVIESTDGRYEASTKGNIRSVSRVVPTNYGTRQIKSVVLKPFTHKHGYNSVVVWSKEKDKRVSQYVHILVAEAFIPKPEGECEINHINHLKTDNSVENLEWCSHKENMVKYSEHSTSKRKVNTCSCGKTISKYTARCVQCNAYNNRTVERPSKEDLFKLLNEYPFEVVGRKYDVTGNAVRKWCRSYGIPSKSSDYK